jgi:hypothetical protein
VIDPTCNFRNRDPPNPDQGTHGPESGSSTANKWLEQKIDKILKNVDTIGF